MKDREGLIMTEGEELWREYCSFFDQPFSEQLEYNELRLKEHFNRWKKTKMAKQLCPKGVKKFYDVPLTTYEDYHILHKFGRRIERLSKKVPRKKGELWWDYYERISKRVAPMLDGWLPDEYGFCVKTSGTTGESKWFAHGKSFSKTSDSVISFVVMACSDRPGDTRLRKGDFFLNITAPPPYISGFAIRSVERIFKLVPPLSVSDEITNMRKKMWMILKMIEKGQRIDVAGGVASIFYMFSKYFTSPDELFKDYYQSANFGVQKFLLFLKYIQCKFSGKKHKKTMEVMPVKGVCLGGHDTRLYLDHIKKEFGVMPTNNYGTTEFGTAFYGHADKKIDYLPDLRCGYFEFLTEEGEIKKIDELKRGATYDLVGTSFGSMPIRYNIGDKLRVTDFRDDGLPMFDIEGRRDQVIDIYGYFRLTQAMAIKTLIKAGLKETDNWCFVKIVSPKEHLLLLMEREWECSEKKASRVVFKALLGMDQYFQNFVRDFGIKDPSEIIKVQYLRKGAFMRYATKKVKDGASIGNVKPPKIITSNKMEEADILRRV
jgi:hypothetical protein